MNHEMGEKVMAEWGLVLSRMNTQMFHSKVIVNRHDIQNQEPSEITHQSNHERGWNTGRCEACMERLYEGECNGEEDLGIQVRGCGSAGCQLMVGRV